MKYVVLLSLLAAAVPAHAQDRAAVSVFLAGAAADDITTWRNMRAGHIENDPIFFFAKDKPKTVVFSLIATDALTLWLAHHYGARHPKLAKFALYSLGTMRGSYGVYNLHWEVTH